MIVFLSNKMLSDLCKNAIIEKVIWFYIKPEALDLHIIVQLGTKVKYIGPESS